MSLSLVWESLSEVREREIVKKEESIEERDVKKRGVFAQNFCHLTGPFHTTKFGECRRTNGKIKTR